MKFNLPCMLYQGRKYAYKKVQRMDPSSIQRGVRQFKTYMSLKLDQVTTYLKLWYFYYPFLIVAKNLSIALIRLSSTTIPEKRTAYLLVAYSCSGQVFFFSVKTQKTFAFHFIEKVEFSYRPPKRQITKNYQNSVYIPGLWQQHPKPFCSSPGPHGSFLFDPGDEQGCRRLYAVKHALISLFPDHPW